MRWAHLLLLVPLFTASLNSAHAGPPQVPPLKLQLTVSPAVQNDFLKGGRLILYLTRQSKKEPRNGFDIVIGGTPQGWNGKRELILDSRKHDLMTAGRIEDFLNAKEPFRYQVLYKQNPDDGQENVPGNLISEVRTNRYTSGMVLSARLQHLIPNHEVVKHPLVKTIIIPSPLLTEFRGRPQFLRASVLLPSRHHDHPNDAYPICYRVPGLNGRFDGVNGLVGNADFIQWWTSGNAPQVIYVCLDSQGPYGDTYQVDSENNGPCGKALTEELIPELERQVGYRGGARSRFLAGASTGGWVALALQIFYPDFFNGTWSYSPDPVDFEHYGLIDIYHDASVFTSRYGYPQPESRSVYGEMKWTMEECIQEENVLGRTGNYLTSGEQFGAYNAVFGPKGKDGLPSLMFDPVTGKIDHTIAKQWEKYDLKKVLEKQWSTLGPKLQGKLWIWTGDMDGLFSNVATRFLKAYLDATQNPKSDAEIHFTPMAGHCQEWSDKTVIERVAAKAASY